MGTVGSSAGLAPTQHWSLPMRETSNDPYATPALKHDRKGPLLRVVVLAVLLGAIGAGYWTMSHQGTAIQSPSAQTVADAAQTMPQAQPRAPGG